MRYMKPLMSLSVLMMLPVVACGGNTIELGEDHGTGAAGSQLGTGTGTGGGSGETLFDSGGDLPRNDGGLAATASDSGAVDSNRTACQCTRRPSGSPSSWCAAGDGTAASFYLTPGGGTFSLGGYQARQSGVDVKLDVPQGAVAEPVWITLTETTCGPPSSFNDASPLYEFAPTDLMFARPITVNLPFGTALADEIGSATIPQNLGIYLSAGDTYERVSNSYANAGFVQGLITHFGLVFAGNPKTPEQAACP
jgi:hypothetical protein